MSDRLTWLVRDAGGNPWAGATPSCTVYDRAGNVRSTPTPTNLGGGLFAVYPTTSDTLAGVVALFDNGASAQTRYVLGVSSAAPLDGFLVTDAFTGALWGGAAPTLGAYRDNTGVDVQPHPALVRIAAYLFSLAPVGVEDVNYRIDAAVNSAVDHDQGAFIQETPAPLPAGVAANFIIKAGDTQASILTTLTDGRTPLSLVGATVQFRMAPYGGNVLRFTRNAVIVDPVSRTVRYDWQAGDTNTPGIYQGEFVVTNAGQVMTYPADGYYTIEVSVPL